jgi:hypothetical protein
VDCSIRELARRVGLSSGTVGYHLRILGPAVLRRRPLTFDLGALGHEDSCGLPVGRGRGGGRSAEDTVDDLLAAVTALQVAVAGLVELVTRLLVASASLNPIERPASADDGRFVARAPRAIAPRSRASSKSVPDDVPESSHSLTELAARSDARETRDDGRATVLDDDELDELLAPLVALCDRLDLVGVTNRVRLRAALQPYGRDQVTHAVGLLTRQLQARAPIRSPVGLLVRLAEQRDLAYFPAIASPQRLAGEQPAPESTGSVEPDAPDLVLSADLAATIDAEITASFAPLPASVRERLLADSDAVHRLRLALLAERIGGQATPCVEGALTQSSTG